MTDEIPIVSKRYEIKSILKADPPAGAEGDDWYRYEIAHGTNSISGYKQGTLEEVTEAMEENVVQLNERQFGKKAMASKKVGEQKAEEKPKAKQDAQSDDSAE